MAKAVRREPSILMANRRMVGNQPCAGGARRQKLLTGSYMQPADSCSRDDLALLRARRYESLPPDEALARILDPPADVPPGLLALCGFLPFAASCRTVAYLIGWPCTEHGARLGRSRLCGLYAEAARPGGELVEAVDESATGSVYFPHDHPQALVRLRGGGVVGCPQAQRSVSA